MAALLIGEEQDEIYDYDDEASSSRTTYAVGPAPESEPYGAAPGAKRKTPATPRGNTVAAARKKTKEAGEPNLEFGSGKSAARHFLKTFFHSLAFSEEGKPDTCHLHGRRHSAQLAFEDSLQQLQLFKLHPSQRQRFLLEKESAQEEGGGSVEPIRMPLDLVRMMKKNAEYTLNKRGGGSYDTYVLCFDKGRFVPPTKKEEEADRDAGVVARLREQEEEAEAQQETPTPGASLQGTSKIFEASHVPHAEQRPYLRLHQGFHCEWDEAMTDREGTRMEIIRNLCQHMLDVYEAHGECDALRAAGAQSPLGAGFQLERGKRVIIDGHCLRVPDVQELDLQIRLNQGQQLLGGENALGHGLSDDDLYEIPICLARDAAGMYSLCLVPELRNRIGETDFTLFFLAERMAELSHVTGYSPYRHGGFDVFSTDTDILHLAMVYLWKLVMCSHAKLGELPPICISYQAQTWALRRTSPYSSKEPWSDVLSLFRYVHQHGIREAQTAHGVLNFAVSAFCGGGDYLFSYPLLPVYWWMGALWHHAPYIGNLVGWGEGKADVWQGEGAWKGPPPRLFVCPQAYERLLRCTYLLANSTLFAEDDDNRGRNASKANRKLLLAGASGERLVVLGQKRPAPPKRMEILDPRRVSRRRIEEATEKYKAEGKLFPAPETIENRRAQLCYYLTLVLQVGSRELHLPDPEDFCYDVKEIHTPLRASGSHSLSQSSSSQPSSSQRTQVTRIYAKRR